jgi:hypothetical protein
MRSFRTPLAAQALVLAPVDATACDRRPQQRTLIASNDGWSVTAIGPLGQADHEVTFDVHRRGQLYASGYLHFDSDSFDREFPNRKWVAPNVLHFGLESGVRPLNSGSATERAGRSSGDPDRITGTCFPPSPRRPVPKSD